jgi:hypothetical protein
MAQQTAVNFLYEFVQLKLTHEQQMQFEGLFQQAKQMEKKQILDAICANQNGLLRRKTVLEAMEYYKEIYGGQGSPDIFP